MVAARRYTRHCLDRTHARIPLNRGAVNYSSVRSIAAVVGDWGTVAVYALSTGFNGSFSVGDVSSFDTGVQPITSIRN
jgi:hypothetical protein